LQQPEAALGEDLVAAGQADQCPGIARRQGPAARPAGHQPPFEAGAIDPHRAASLAGRIRAEDGAAAVLVVVNVLADCGSPRGTGMGDRVTARGNVSMGASVRDPGGG
jgi:hypothetical protein